MKKNKTLSIIWSLMLTLIPFSYTQAADWSTTSVSILHGTNYAIESTETKDILTFEHANSWAYGDNFFFFDVGRPFQDGTKIYGEWQPRFSLGKIFTKKPLTYGAIKDVFIATQINMGGGSDQRAFLYGLGLSLDIPYFVFFDFNVYVRDDRSVSKQTFQLTIAWLVNYAPHQKIKLSFGGFVDYAGKAGTIQQNILAQPQLLFDLGNLWAYPEHLFVGVEYQYWYNKFGVKGVNDSVFQAMAKWVF